MSSNHRQDSNESPSYRTACLFSPWNLYKTKIQHCRKQQLKTFAFLTKRTQISMNKFFNSIFILWNLCWCFFFFLFVFFFLNSISWIHFTHEFTRMKKIFGYLQETQLSLSLLKRPRINKVHREYTLLVNIFTVLSFCFEKHICIYIYTSWNDWITSLP